MYLLLYFGPFWSEINWVSEELGCRKIWISLPPRPFSFIVAILSHKTLLLMRDKIWSTRKEEKQGGHEIQILLQPNWTRSVLPVILFVCFGKHNCVSLCAVLVRIWSGVIGGGSRSKFWGIWSDLDPFFKNSCFKRIWSWIFWTKKDL